MKTSTSNSAVLRRATLAALAAAAIALFTVACEVDSADSASGVVSDSSGTIYDFSGTYYSTSGDGGPLVSPSQSGRAITWLRLTQYGSVLEGYDSSRQSWKGKISGVTSGGNASFTLDGATTAGLAVNIAGTLRYADAASTMDASWIEASGRACTINAQASVSAPNTHSNTSSSVSISPSSASISKGASRTFKASGGVSPYSWSLSTSAYGSLSSSSGSSVTFYASSSDSGSVTITVSDSLSSSSSASITVN